MPRGRGVRRQRRQQHYPLRNRRGQVQRDNPQGEVEQIAAEPEAVPHVPEVQLPEPEINLPTNAPAHTNTIGVQADNIENIESWTDAFCNFAKVALQRHPMLATDLISYMILIRGAVSDALFERVYNYDKQFRLRMHKILLGHGHK